MVRKYGFLAIPVIIVLLFVGCATRIGPGRVGIKVDLAGSQRGVEDLAHPYRLGFLQFPFIDDCGIPHVRANREVDQGPERGHRDK